MPNLRLSSFVAALFLGISFISAQAQVIPSKVLGADRSSLAITPSDFSKFIPAHQILTQLRPVETPSLERTVDPKAPTPVVVPGNRGGAVVPNKISAPVDGGIAPRNYGTNNLNTVNHYSDKLVPTLISSHYPYRTTGWFTFTRWDGQFSRCTAALISKSILATAGHCVHKGGGGADFFIKSGTFYPAYANGSQPYGSATVDSVYTTAGWYNTGGIDMGHDLALVVLNKRLGTTTEMGTTTGWLGYCANFCLQKYWYNTQLGYPINYYGGNLLVESQHLEYSDGFDYRAGTGMRHGSSGGPHITNIGELSDTSTNAGQYTVRNILYAVTSWGYVDQSVKIAGFSTTTGPNNANNFVAIWNAACARAQALHGISSCALRPL